MERAEARGRAARKRHQRIARALAAAAFALLWLTPSRAPATIEEQRARLPPAAECDDEIVAGVWRSHSYHPQFGDWGIFTLTIRRVPGSPEQLIGTITNHTWQGGPADEEPPACAQGGGDEWVVSMDARGSVQNGNRIFFGGVGSWRVDEVRCSRGPWGYNLDNFTGVIDPAILEFQSVNNDGGRAVDEPEVFRRIRCPPVPSAESPSVTTRPPAFYPELGGGCGLW
jgi:hypothetical protein